MTDDEIAARIVKILNGGGAIDVSYWVDPIDVSNWLDCAEAYRLAFVGCVRERAKVRREQKRVRKLVFAELRLHDRRVVEK